MQYIVTYTMYIFIQGGGFWELEILLRKRKSSFQFPTSRKYKKMKRKLLQADEIKAKFIDLYAKLRVWQNTLRSTRPIVAVMLYGQYNAVCMVLTSKENEASQN